MDTKGGKRPGRGGDGGMNGEIGIDIHTLICIKWITNKNLLYKKINKIKFKNSKKKKKRRGDGPRPRSLTSRCRCSTAPIPARAVRGRGLGARAPRSSAEFLSAGGM